MVHQAGLRSFIWWVLLWQPSFSHTLTHKNLNSAPIVLHQQKTSQSRGAAHCNGTDFPHFYFKFLKNLLLQKERSFYPWCLPQLWPQMVENNLIVTSQPVTSPDIRHQTADCNSVPTDSQWIGTALEEESCTHFSEACCHEKVLESQTKIKLNNTLKIKLYSVQCR